ncbi:Panacea domain-containing protein [Devosia submarina]|uniref:Panacea domain-containing protein n=1 Tax=Devosia submarina TaxID=1173082 RepID=UPI001300AD2F|nr:type II toxin-antitoxin system antitoxin SocA domain-containing protein [Devosia submarina]
MTNLALQKIVYFCHVWSLIGLRRPLIRHKFEAWEFGPVLPYLYREFKSFDRSPIKGRATEIDPQNGSKRIVSYSFGVETEKQLQEIVAFYSQMRPSDLVELSHVRGGPWHSTWNHGGNVNPGMKIDDSLIAAFYSKVSSPFSIQ